MTGALFTQNLVDETCYDPMILNPCELPIIPLRVIRDDKLTIS